MTISTSVRHICFCLLKTADTVLVPKPVDSRTQSPVDLGSRGTVTLQRTPARQNEKEKNIVREFTAVSPTPEEPSNPRSYGIF